MIFFMLIWTLPGSSHAKWWIFGKSSEGIHIQYLYINSISFDQSADTGMTLFQNQLRDGNIVIKGRASASNGRIGSVQVSVDNKETWSRARVAQNGSFEFLFQPELEKPYDLFVKIMDTTGKTNDVDATHKTVTVTDQDILPMVRASLDALFSSYQAQNPEQFMQYVHPAFETDESLLDTAIRKDFNSFDYIQIQYVVNTIGAGSQGRIFVSINYNRSVVATKTGETLSDFGLTEFVFAMDQAVPKLVRIKNPLLFGLSEAPNLATGTINSGTAGPILLVDEFGNVQKQSFRDAINTIDSGNTFSSGPVEGVRTGTITVVSGANLIEGYSFSYDALMPTELGAPAGSNVKDLFGADIDTQSSVTVTGADNDFINIFPAASGNSYAIRFSDGTYMLLQHTAGAGVGATVKYRYQPNGTSSF